jgi:predicted MFS family arabinose efflux permease
VGVAGAGSMVLLTKLKLPDMSERTTSTRKGMDLGRLVDVIRSDSTFRNYCLAIFVYRLSMSMPSALYAIYKVRVLGASDSWIGITLTAERLISVVTYFAMAQILTRPRYRRWLWLTLLGVAFYPFTTALARTPEMLLIPALCGGLFGAGANIFLTNVLFQVSPEDQRPTYVSIDSFLANANAFIAPMLGTALADGISLTTALLIIAGLRLLGGLAFWRLGVGLKEE